MTCYCYQFIGGNPVNVEYDSLALLIEDLSRGNVGLPGQQFSIWDQTGLTDSDRRFFWGKLVYTGEARSFYRGG